MFVEIHCVITGTRVLDLFCIGYIFDHPMEMSTLPHKCHFFSMKCALHLIVVHVAP
jgi:hypothetical protein